MQVDVAYDRDLVLDTLSSSTKTANTVAFSTRLLSKSYIGPAVKIRNSATGTTQDFYADSSGNLGSQLGAVGTTVESFLAPKTSAVYLANEANVTAGTAAANYITSSYTFPAAFSVSFWGYVTAGNATKGDCAFVTTNTSSFLTGALTLAWYNNAWAASLSGVVATATFSTNLNTWTHVCATYSGTTLTFYANGSRIGTATGTLAQSGFMLGNQGTTTTNAFAGYISDFRIYNRALSTPEIQYLAGINSTPQAGITNMTVYLPFQSSTSDLSGNNVAITTTGSVSYVGTTLSLPTLGTVDTWYDQSGNARHATQTTVGNQPVLFKRSTGYVVSFNDAAAQYMNYGLTGTSSIWHNTNYTLIAKEQRASNKLSNFIHGATTQTANQNLYIGYDSDVFQFSQWVNGFGYTIGNFAIYDTTNTYSPISTYTTGTPILTTDSPFTTAEGSFGFDGVTGKYISISATALTSGFQWWTGGGSTMECWVKYMSFTNASSGNGPVLVGYMAPTSGIDNWSFGITTTGTLKFFYWNGTTGNIVESTSTISLNTWTHIAMSCDGSANIRIFINGTLAAGPTAVSGTPASDAANFTIAQFNTVSANVYISNLRIVKGTALYTASFTPSTSPLTTASSGTTLILLRMSSPINRWLVSHHTTDNPGKRMYLNGTQVAILANNTSITSPGQATIGRLTGNTTWYYNGDLYELLGFNISLPVSDATAITTTDTILTVNTRPGVSITGNAGGSFIGANTVASYGIQIHPTILATNCIGAYSVGKLIPTYTGPTLQLKRDADNAIADVWIDGDGSVIQLVDTSLDDGSTSGGTITYDGAYRIHTFTSSGTFTVNKPCICDILIVGGGGGGGYRQGGGGGGGGLIQKYQQYVAQSVSVVVGGGGTAGVTGARKGTIGNSSSFGSHIAIGGGGGGGDTDVVGGNGGSGGGGSGAYTVGFGGQAIPRQGNAGGRSSGGGVESNWAGGGGGGASTAGADALNATPSSGGNGGSGRSSMISGTTAYYSGGGGGGCASTSLAAGTGGIGGGGAGSLGAVTSTSGTINTGGGGGGSGFVGATNGTAANGGSGIVIVRTLRHPGIQGRSAISTWLGASTATLTKWYDQSGNSNHVTTIRGTPRISTYPSDVYLYGSSNDGMRFPTTILPSTYTLFHTAQYQATGTKQRIFDGASNQWASGFVNGIQGTAVHSSNDYTYPHGVVVNSIGTATGATAGGTGPLIDSTSFGFPHVALNGTSSTVGDYFSYSSTTWNIATNGGFSFIGMVRFNTSTNSWERIFNFGNGSGSTFNNDIQFFRNGTTTTISFQVYEGTTPYSFSATSVITNGSWQIFACRLQNEGTNTWRFSIWVNGVKYTGNQLTSTVITDKSSLVQSYIGRSPMTGDFYADIDIRELLFYNDDLTDTQIDTLYNYLNNKYNLRTIAKTTAPPISPYLSFDLNINKPVLRITSIQGWTGTAVGTVGPLLDPTGSVPHIALNGSSTTVGDYFNFGSTTWNVATNGGFTFIGMVRFNANNNWGRIFDFATGTLTNDILFGRSGTTSSLVLSVREGATVYDKTFTNMIVNGTWQIFAGRIQNIGGTNWNNSVWKDGVKSDSGSYIITTLSDRTETLSYIGKSSTTADNYADIDIRELLWYNQPLSDAQVTTLYNYLNNKYNTNPAPWMTPPITPYLAFHPYYLIQASPAPFLGSHPANGTAVSYLNGATAYAVGGSAGPLLQREAGIPYIALNATSATVGDYFNYGSTTWNVSTNGGFSFIGMVRFNASLLLGRIFDFGNGSDNYNIIFDRYGTTTSLRFAIVESTTTFTFQTFANMITDGTWQIFGCRLQNQGGNNWIISVWKDGVKTSGTLITTPLTDRTVVNSYVGRANYIGEGYNDIDIRECLWFNDDLTDDQFSMLYQYLNNKYNNQSIPWFSKSPITPYLQLDVTSYIQDQRVVPNITSLVSSVASTGTLTSTATAASAGGSPGPILNITGGTPHISLNGTSATVGDYFNFGSTTWNLATNGGFTFIGMVRFNNSANTTERIFDFGNGLNTDNILLSRAINTTNLYVQLLFGGVSLNSITLSSAIVNGSWQIFAMRLQNEGTNLWRIALWVNGVKTNGSQFSGTLTDKAFTYNYIGKSEWADYYADIDIRELLWYNDDLSDAQIQSLNAYLVRKYSSPSTFLMYETPPITPYLSFDVTTLLKTKPNLVCSVDQNNPDLFRVNGITTASATTTSTNPQLSINYGASGEYSDWIVKDVVVFNNTLATNDIMTIENTLMRKQLGVLDQISSTAGTSCVAAYALYLLTNTYTGPIINVRRSTDNATKDFYANTQGELGDQYMGLGTHIQEWLGSATGYITQWYDQSGRGKHVTQATAGSQPYLIFSKTEGNAVYFNGTTMAGPNVFDTTTVTDMHVIMVSKEIVRTGGNQILLSLHGTNTGLPPRFFIHSPYGNGIWYFDPGNASTDRSSSSEIITAVGQKAVFSGYKSSTDAKNGFRVNSGPRYLSSVNNAGSVSGGIKINLDGSTNHYLYSVVVFSAKLDSISEQFLENAMNYKIQRNLTSISTVQNLPIPNGLTLYLDANNYSSGTTWFDLSGNGYDFTISASAAQTDRRGFKYMNFSGAYGTAKRVVNSALTDVPAVANGTIIVFSTILNYTGDWRTLLRGAANDHQVIISNGGNILGMYDNNANTFISSGFDITNLPSPYTQFNMLVFKFSTSSPYYQFTYNNTATYYNITDGNATFNNGFTCIGAYHNFSIDPLSNQQYWGNISCFLYYNRFLSDMEITEIYNRYKTRYNI